jgi:cob(I)alamin adenosyltransferase
MKIYTGTGDTGTTGLIKGGRVSKSDIRISTYGTIDELNAALGFSITEITTVDINSNLRSIQNDLFVLGSDLASPLKFQDKDDFERLDESYIKNLEELIDRFEEKLPELTEFILPGGSKGSAHLHLSRTICRRAERSAVELSANEDIGSFVVKYLNRLSDLLFVLSRFENSSNDTADITWSNDRSQ